MLPLPDSGQTFTRGKPMDRNEGIIKLCYLDDVILFADNRLESLLYKNFKDK
jgi:hypothetical protein